MKSEIGKVFIDLGKLAFAGLVIAGLLREDIPPVLLILTGATASIATITIGLYMIWSDRKKQSKQQKQ